MDSDNKSFEQLISELQVHESEDQLIIGLDFGTTVSNILLCQSTTLTSSNSSLHSSLAALLMHSLNLTNLNLSPYWIGPVMLLDHKASGLILRKHAGLEGKAVPKVPTIISYDPDNVESFTWGAQRHMHSKLEGIKLLLDLDQETPIYVPALNAKAALKRLGKPPVEVAADYIEAMYKHAMGRLESKMTLEYLQICQKRFVLSVPAVWSDKAKDLTMRV